MKRAMKLKVEELGDEIVELSARRDSLASQVLVLEERLGDGKDSKIAKRVGPTIYEFDEQDRTALAFDEFYGDIDPQIEKIRDDLLNDSDRRRRFSVLSARLGG